MRNLLDERGERGSEELYARARERARRTPSWLLRRRERRIVARRFPDVGALAELAASRSELRIRSGRWGRG
jgi:hypothetical protein